MTVPLQSLAVPALNLKAQYQTIRDEIEPVVLRLFESQMFVMGPEVEKLEAELAEYCGVARGIGCASGTDALLLPLMARGIGPGDEVITTPYTFFATAGSIWRTGARPIFVDIETDTYNIDPRGSRQPSHREHGRSSRFIFTANVRTWPRFSASPQIWPFRA